MIIQEGWAMVRFSAHLLSSGETLGVASTDGALWVVTSIDVVNSAGSSGDGFQLFTHTTNTLFHAGGRGAGGFDTFPWRGELILSENDGVGINVFGGTWDVVGNGYLVPDRFNLL